MPPRTRIRLLDPSALSTSMTPTPSASHCSQCLLRQTRSFSSSPRPTNGQRKKFYAWLQGPGANFKDPLPDGTGTNYLNAYSREGILRRADGRGSSSGGDGDGEDGGSTARDGVRVGKESAQDLMVYPGNKHFQSQSVLSEAHKEAIWRMVRDEGRSVRDVSNFLGVEMNRVGAVVRLMGVQKDWERKGKPLAKAYSRAILNMLPVEQYRGPPRNAAPITPFPFESIDDLNVHRATKAQIFYPASESRQFTRADAGAAFERGLLPADERIPHPEAIRYHANQHSQQQREDSTAALQAAYDEELKEREVKAERKARWEERNVVKMEGERAVFRITNVTVDTHTVGKNGRGPHGVGHRYGLPHQDRKKGQIKIPTSVR